MEQELFNCQQVLEVDAAQDGEGRERHGDKWRIKPAASMAKPYWDRISQYRWGLGGLVGGAQGVRNASAVGLYLPGLADFIPALFCQNCLSRALVGSKCHTAGV